MIKTDEVLSFSDRVCVCVYLCAASSLSLRCCSALISLSSCLAAFCSSTQSSIRSLLDASVSSFATSACRIFSFSPTDAPIMINTLILKFSAITR